MDEYWEKFPSQGMTPPPPDSSFRDQVLLVWLLQQLRKGAKPLGGRSTQKIYCTVCNLKLPPKICVASRFATLFSTVCGNHAKNFLNCCRVCRWDESALKALQGVKWPDAIYNSFLSFLETHHHAHAMAIQIRSGSVIPCHWKVIV